MGALIKMEQREGLGGNFSYSSDDDSDRKKDIAVRKNTPYYSQDITEGIRFVLSHFQESLYPRTISTKYTRDTQIPIYNYEQLYKEFAKANFIDCRISAFPLTENPVPNLVFIDLDKNDNSEIRIEKKLEVTLTNIKKRLSGHPTVLWTGNGYHIYQPFEVSKRLSEMEEFNDIEETDNKFLRFEKDTLSNGYADKANHPSLKSCLMRVPYSINSKCLSKRLSEEESRVKIIQKWDGNRVPISYQIGTFHSHLISEKQKEEKRRALYTNRFDLTIPQPIPWIEKLLKTPIDDHRHLCLWHILIPYLVNIKRLPETEVISILEKWLESCDTKRKLTFRPLQRIKSLLRSVKGHLPISKENLKKEYPEVYDTIKE